MKPLEPGCLAIIVKHDLSKGAIGSTVTCESCIPKGTKTQYGVASHDLWNIDMKLMSQDQRGAFVLIPIVRADCLMRIDGGESMMGLSEERTLEKI